MRSLRALPGPGGRDPARPPGPAERRPRSPTRGLLEVPSTEKCGLVNCALRWIPIRLARVREGRACRAFPARGRPSARRQMGDGGEHLHWGFMAQAARMSQLIGSFAAIWDDILPKTPQGVWNSNLAAIAHVLTALAGLQLG